jgi:hypothetical protein
VGKKKEGKPGLIITLTLAASQTLTVLSNEEVARHGVLGLKRTSVMSREWSSSIDFCFRLSAFHRKTCIARYRR